MHCLTIVAHDMTDQMNWMKYIILISFKCVLCCYDLSLCIWLTFNKNVCNFLIRESFRITSREVNLILTPLDFASVERA